MSILPLPIAVLALAASFAASHAGPSALEDVQGKYSISPVSSQKASAFVAFKRFRVLPSGKIVARATYGSDVTYRFNSKGTKVRSDRQGRVDGRVSSVSKPGRTRVTFDGHGGGIRYRFKLRNFSGQTDVFRGRGWVKFRGKKFRVRIANNEEFGVFDF